MNAAPHAPCERLTRLAVRGGEGHRRAGRRNTVTPCLDDKTQALIRLAALVATGGGPASYQHHVAGALAAGATPDEVVGTLLAVAPTVGVAHLVSATVGLALGLGYDIDHALEEPDDTAGRTSSCPAVSHRRRTGGRRHRAGR